VLNAVVEEAGSVLNASAAAVIRVDDLGGQLVITDARFGQDPGAQRALASIVVNGEQWGVLEVTSAATGPPVDADRLKPFADLIAAAIANADHRERLTQSRARVIAAADEARRKLQRDVHDGAQQRLVHTIILLKLARRGAAAGEDVSELLAEALVNAEEANQQLRDVVRGVLPAALTRAGLTAAIESLVADSAVPVDLSLAIPRLPTAIETTGYFTVAEAITNAVKHARATRIRVHGALSAECDELVLAIDDDGIGGADASRGTGLTGLTDRIEASKGKIAIVSSAGGGTHITVHIPVDTGDVE
jgi:signal transduction histidine kinase